VVPFSLIVGKLRFISDEEDETAELMRELEKIKRERAEQREKEVSHVPPLLSTKCVELFCSHTFRKGKRPPQSKNKERRISPLVILCLIPRETST
jgi:hypothetical protein